MAENYAQLEQRLRDALNRNDQLVRENKMLHELVLERDDSPYYFQHAVGKMMQAFGQTTRRTPEIDGIDEKELRLRATLVLSEALEFVAALGYVPTFHGDNSSDMEEDFSLERILDRVDLPEAADAIADILVVTFGAANSFGIDAVKAFKEVHDSNMSKVVDGQVQRRESDGKVIKPESFHPPDMVKVLREQGWEEQG